MPIPEVKEGGRVENYRGDPPLGDEAFDVVKRLMLDAIRHLEAFNATAPRALPESPEAVAKTILALAARTLEELARPEKRLPSSSMPSERGRRPSLDTRDRTRLTCDDLRWTCPEDWLGFDTTASVDPITGFESQVDPLEALKFGLECPGIGQNVYVAGLSGGGRLKLASQLVRELSSGIRRGSVHCYVRNFSEPDRPRLIELPFGQGRLFSRRIRALADFLTDGFTIALESSAAKSRSDELQQKEQQSVGEITKNFEKTSRRCRASSS